MTVQIQVENPLLARARGSHNTEDCMALYEEWAATYNDVLADASQNYVAPFLVAQAALKWKTNPKGPILDAGCGTGLVAEALLRSSSTVTVDGIDLSPAMLKVARQTGIYRDLTIGDLNQKIEKPNEFYDIVTCAGTFTEGHVGPDPALREFARITKKNGIIVASILNKIWKTGGYKTEIEKLEVEGLFKVLSMEVKDYRKGAGDKATFVVLEKI